MNTKKAKNMDIILPKGTAFAYDTDLDCPKCHQLCLVVGKRGSGKSVSAVNLIEKMKYDRVLVISPTMISNKDLMSRLNIDPFDIWDDPDKPSIIDEIKAVVEEEAQDLDKYIKDMRDYNLLMRLINKNDVPIPDELLSTFFNPVTNQFDKPQHKYNGRKCRFCLLIDDAVGSHLFSRGVRKLNALTILHRHLGQLTETDGALGISIFFLVQSYVAQHNGLTKVIRNQATSIILFKTKNDNELKQVIDECSGEVDEDLFLKMYSYATLQPHDFLFIDLHPKKEHASQFRRCFNEYIIPEQFCKCKEIGLPEGSCGKMVQNTDEYKNKSKQKGKKSKKLKDGDVETDSKV